MLSVIFLLSIIWCGFILDEEYKLSRGDFFVRLASAIVLGCFWSAWVVFLLSWAFGFSRGTVLGATGLILVLNLLAWRFRRRDFAWFTSLIVINRRFWQAALFSTVVLTAYFSVCVWMNPDGDILFRGNTRDLAFHMGTVSAFLEQSAFPPLNPQSAAAKLSYHFMADFFSAVLCRGGFSLFYSLKIPMVLFAFCLGTLTNHFLFSVLKSRTVTVFAGILFFFGHIGFINLIFGIAGYPVGEVPLVPGSWNSIVNHLLYPYYNFLNVVIDYFQPQLPFLFGFPVAMLVLATMYRRFCDKTPTDRTTFFIVALIAFLPLFHIHTFLTLGPLVLLMVLFEEAPVSSPGGSSESFAARLVRRTVDQEAPTAAHVRAFADPAARSVDAIPSPDVSLKVFGLFLAAIPIGLQLGFVFSQEKTAGFSGFDVAKRLGSLPEIPTFLHLQRLWFWLRAAGAPLLLGLPGIFLWFHIRRRDAAHNRREGIALFVLLAVTGSFFLLINFFRFTPNWGDNNKFFLYFDLVLCLFAGQLLAFCWEKSTSLRVLACVVLSFFAIAPVTIEWVERLGRQPELLFSASDRLVGEWIRLNTPKDAVFLTANSVVHLVPALAGRRVVNGAYTWETGFASQGTVDLVARAFREADPSVIRNIEVTHVMVGPEEEGLYHVIRATYKDRFRQVLDQSSRNVRYTVYEVRKRSLEEIERERTTELTQPFVWLSALEPLSVQQYGTLRLDKSFNQTPLTLLKQIYPYGLGTHAPSEIRFDLDKAYTFFDSTIGVDDTEIAGISSVVFQVWVDDRKAYESKVLHAGDPVETVRVDVSGASTLGLVVTDAGDGNHCDHGDWAGARLTRKP